MCLSQDVKQNLQIFEYLQDYQKDYSGSRSNIWIFKLCSYYYHAIEWRKHTSCVSIKDRYYNSSSFESSWIMTFNFMKCDSCFITIFCWEGLLPSNSTNGLSIAWYRRDKPSTIISHFDSLSSAWYSPRFLWRLRK